MRSRFQVGVVSLLAIAAMCIGVGCSSGSKGGGSSRSVAAEVRSSGLVSQGDSLAYIVGMNIAEQLQKMDSTINVGVVCRAIMEQFEGVAVMSRNEAREQYLRYLLFVEPERRRSYEEKFLVDLAANDRTFTRTKSGLTYHIAVIGDESLTPKNDNDWVTLRLSIERVGGESVVKNYEQSLALSDMLEGVKESVKMIGKGGKIEAWMPSKIAYGEEGDEEFGVEPIETLLYTIEVVDVERNAASKRKVEQTTF